MNDRNALTVSAAENADGLGRECYLGHHHYNALAVLYTSVDDLQDYLGLSAARYSVEQGAFRRLFRIEIHYRIIRRILRGAQNYLRGVALARVVGVRIAYAFRLADRYQSR